jgi:protein SCO1
MSQAPKTDSTIAPAGRAQRIFTAVLWLGMISAILCVIGAKIILPHRDIPVLFNGGSYSLVDQNGIAFNDESLRGKLYICDFIFTTCGSSCPIMSSKLSALQPKLPKDVHFVSFTVNPEHDTPAVLKEYAKEYHADESRWHLLTGSSRQMFAIAQQMKMTAQPATENTPILHSDRFLLVDGDGNVRGVYDSNDTDSMSKLIADAKYLANSRGGRG